MSDEPIRSAPTAASPPTAPAKAVKTAPENFLAKGAKAVLNGTAFVLSREQLDQNKALLKAEWLVLDATSLKPVFTTDEPKALSEWIKDKQVELQNQKLKEQRENQRGS